MSKYQPYPAYKDSGTQWLGKIPEHWSAKRCKHLFKIKKRIAGKAGFDVLSITQQGIKVKDIKSGEGQLSMDYSKYQMVEIGDFAMNHMDLLTGFVDISSQQGVTSPDYRVFTLIEKQANSQYYLSLFQYGYKQKIFYAFGQGASHLGRWRLPTDEFENFIMPYPNYDEQVAIANFLDRETRKIDTLIGKQSKLIELLKEKRQAVISHAVTKGLNPDAPLKDSGIEWLGQIPEHWEVKKLKFLCSIGTGDKDTADAKEDGEYPFFVRSQIVQKIESYSFNGEAVLTAGDGAGVGKVFHYFNGKFNYHQRVYRFSHFKYVLGKFFFEYLKNNLYKVALEGTAKSTVDSLRLPLLQDFFMTVPPKREQQKIIDYLDNQTQKIDTLIDKSQQAIELLKERKTALISAAVTGKIDAREVA